MMKGIGRDFTGPNSNKYLKEINPMRSVNFVINAMANKRKLIILMVREGNECDLDM